MKDAAENGGKNYHDCKTIGMLWGVFYYDSENIKAGTSKYTMTIHEAVLSGYHGTLKLLLDSNADIDSRNSELGATALHLAASAGHTKIVRALLDAKAKVESLDGYDMTPLCYAVNKGHSEICQMLLKSDVSPQPRRDPLNFLVITAVHKGYVEIVSALLEAGADVDVAQDVGPVAGPTLLHVAAEKGHKALVGVLLEAGAQVNPRTMTGATPLHQAAIYGHTEVVKCFLMRVLTLMRKNMMGWHPWITRYIVAIWRQLRKYCKRVDDRVPQYRLMMSGKVWTRKVWTRLWTDV